MPVINKFYLLCVIFSGSPDLTLKTCLVRTHQLSISWARWIQSTCYLLISAIFGNFIYIETEAWNQASIFFKFKILFSIALPSTRSLVSGLFSLLFLQTFVCTKYHVCCMPSPSHLPWYDHLMMRIQKCIIICVMLFVTALLIYIWLM